MEEGFRYKMQHLGDIFMNKVDNVCQTVKSSTKGIVLTYDIDGLQKEKDKLLKRIGIRAVAIRNKGPGFDVSTDAMLTKLFYRYDRVEDKIAACINERKERLYPGTRVAKQ